MPVQFVSQFALASVDCLAWRTSGEETCEGRRCSASNFLRLREQLAATPQHHIGLANRSSGKGQALTLPVSHVCLASLETIPFLAGRRIAAITDAAGMGRVYPFGDMVSADKKWAE